MEEKGGVVRHPKEGGVWNSFVWYPDGGGAVLLLDQVRGTCKSYLCETKRTEELVRVPH